MIVLPWDLGGIYTITCTVDWLINTKVDMADVLVFATIKFPVSSFLSLVILMSFPIVLFYSSVANLWVS